MLSGRCDRGAQRAKNRGGPHIGLPLPSYGGRGVSGEGEAVAEGFLLEVTPFVDGLDPFIPDQLTGAVQKVIEESAAACFAEVGGRFLGEFIG